MARVKYGVVVTELKGKLSGAVFQKCGQTLSIRTHVRGKTNLLAPSQDARNNWAYIANKWRTLSDAQRLSFFTYASTYPTFDKYGAPLVLNGYQLFMLINSYYSHVTSVVFDTCQTWAPPSGIIAGLSDWDVSLNQMTYTGTADIPPNCVMFVYVMPYKNTGVLTDLTKFVYIGYVAAGTARGANIANQFNANFRYPKTVGLGYRYYCQLFDMVTGGWVMQPLGIFNMV